MLEHPNVEYIANRVESAGDELRIRATDRLATPASRSCAKMDENACRAAALLIQELDRELFRVRTAAALHLQGRLGKQGLKTIIQSWNDAERTPRPEIP